MKNLVLKNILKLTIFKIVTFVNKIVPKDDRKVLLYIPRKRLTYSLGPLKEYLIANGFEKKYDISYGMADYEYAEGNSISKVWAHLNIFARFMRSTHVFYTSGQIPIKPSKKQIVIHVRHGNANFKPVGKLANIDNGDEYFFTYMIAPSELYIPIMAKEYACSESCIKVAGDPMTDELLNAPKGSYDFSSYKKMLIWTPTFRQSGLMGYTDSNMNTLIPLFDMDDYPELNNLLAKHNVKLIVKLHPIQTVPRAMQRHFSHLSVYSHDEFISTDYNMFKLIADSDGMIGDYSSVSMQYLLTDRPLAFVVPDIDDYASNRGFVFENPEDYMGGHIIKTKEQFNQFIEDFANGDDVYRDKRHWVCDKVYKYKDTKSCERIVELSRMSL